MEVREVHETIARHAAENVSLVDELLRERRELRRVMGPSGKWYREKDGAAAAKE